VLSPPVQLGIAGADRDQAGRQEVNRRLSIALIIIAGAVLAVVILLSIEALLIDWGDW
jgi:hypothetical protein